MLGLVVSLSTFLVIGATSSLTYNVVGHVKTVIILVGGVVFFGDRMPLAKLAGISLAMGGIIWYSQVGSCITWTACSTRAVQLAWAPSNVFGCRSQAKHACLPQLLSEDTRT